MIYMLVLTVCLSVGLAQLIDPLYVFGGADCSTTNGVYACANYLPTGVLVAAVVSVILVTGFREATA
jgi:hypothetical protein